MNPNNKRTQLTPHQRLKLYSTVVECFLTMENNTAENIANHLGIKKATVDYHITKYLNNKFKNLKL